MKRSDQFQTGSIHLQDILNSGFRSADCSFKMWQAVLYLALCVSSATAQTTLDPYWPCPDPGLFNPCKCITESGDPLIMDIDCSEALDDVVLGQAFQAPMSFCTYRNLKITGSEFSSFNRFTLDTFGCASFETMEISGTSLQVIEDGTLFRSEGKLTSLNLDNNAIRSFPFESLSGFTVLETLLLNNNLLTTVQKIISPSLVTLSLDYNPNLDISLGLFAEAQELQTLGISNCNLADFTEDMFLPLENLVSLDLSGNKFQELKPSSIRLIGKTLESLDMSNNPLAYVGIDAISGKKLSLIEKMTQGEHRLLYGVTKYTCSCNTKHSHNLSKNLYVTSQHKNLQQFCFLYIF